MKISNTKKTPSKSESTTSKPLERKVSEEKDYRDLEDSLTDWNAEQNHSGRKK